MSKKAPDPGTDLIEAIRTGLPVGVELDEREEALLDLAARQARDVAAAEADIADRGFLVDGSRGTETSPVGREDGRRELGLVADQLRESGIEVVYDEELQRLAEAPGSCGLVALDLSVAVAHGVESLSAGPSQLWR